MVDTFTFSKDSLVPETLPPDPVQGVTLNGWGFTSRPSIPYQKKFKVTLYGLRWYEIMTADEGEEDTIGLFDEETNPDYNARLLEKFYEDHGTWSPFEWAHPHLGLLTVRFNAPLAIPAGIPNSGGLVEKVEINLIHHNPSY